jgi:hypothetical protein
VWSSLSAPLLDLRQPDTLSEKVGELNAGRELSERAILN